MSDKRFESSTDRTEYVRPTVETLSDQDILEEIGPAQAYTGTFPFSF